MVQRVSVAITRTITLYYTKHNSSGNDFSKMPARYRDQNLGSCQASRLAEKGTGARIATLPRLGSRVRIPSPAPEFLRKIKDFEAALWSRFCLEKP